MQRRTFSGVLGRFQGNAFDAVCIAAALAISIAATMIPARLLPHAANRQPQQEL